MTLCIAFKKYLFRRLTDNVKALLHILEVQATYTGSLYDADPLCTDCQRLIAFVPAAFRNKMLQPGAHASAN